jgi:6-phosphogluconolactonase
MSAVSARSGKDLRLFVGTYTEPEQSTSEGVYMYRMDPSGRLTDESVIPDVVNPSYLAVHPQTGYLYAVSEKGTFDGQPNGGVVALSVDRQTGKAGLLNKQSSGGEDPCYISIERTGRYALVANYTSGNVAMLPILPSGGLEAPSHVVEHSGSSVHPYRQDKPYAHCILPDPTNRFAVTVDLGIDKIILYRMDLDAGQLHNHAEVKVPEGSGPRHLIFHPNGRYAYVVCELSSTLLGFRYESETGSLGQIQSIGTLPRGFDGPNSCADLHITPDGRYLYASNRGHDSFACFSIDSQSGELAVLDHIPSGGNEPRGFEIAPGGKFLLAANQNSNNIVTLLIDPARGQLSRTGDEVEVSMPVCIKFA